MNRPAANPKSVFNPVTGHPVMVASSPHGQNVVRQHQTEMNAHYADTRKGMTIREKMQEHGLEGPED